MYRSTRSHAAAVPAERAIIDGIAPDGGLYVPESLPRLSPAALGESPLSYAALSREILRPFLPSFPEAGLEEAIAAAAARFDAPDVAPTVRKGDYYFLELFHGPTIAFKDLALSLMGGVAGIAKARAGIGEELVVLVATSGDTGKAALAGFADLPGFRVIVFYPERGVSPVQKLQMVTHESSNAIVVGIRGNFDDAQRGVKGIFADEEAKSRLAARGARLTSANSINIARLLPQIVYYVKAWRDLRGMGALGGDGSMDVAVPTGNFGNILAAWYAKRMGLPIGRLVCASNRNRVLADFFERRVYDRNRELYPTTSPSMDILVSSNLERLLFHASGDDPGRTAELMRSLAAAGSFSLNSSESAFLADFSGGSADDAEAESAIRETFRSAGYLLDPHTAVAVSVLDKLRSREGTSRPTLVVATASPFKFPLVAARALGTGPNSGGPEDEIEAAAELAKRLGLALPKAVAELRGKPVRHGLAIDPGDMKATLLRSLRA